MFKEGKIENFLESERKIYCPERQEVANNALERTQKGLAFLGMEKWNSPHVDVGFKFFDEGQSGGFGCVKVGKDRVEIIYDKKMANQKDELIFVLELRKEGIDYPGFENTLSHELAHVALWQVTGMERQAATRLLDEGWAELISCAGKENLKDLSDLTKEIKKIVRQGLEDAETVKSFERCLDFKEIIQENESDLNAAEYKVGEGLLLWIYEKFGKSAMVDLLKKSPQAQRRNDDLDDDSFELALIDPKIHVLASEYFKLMKSEANGELVKEDLIEKAKKWEGEQFTQALLETTGCKNVEEIVKRFKEWLYE